MTINFKKSHTIIGYMSLLLFQNSYAAHEKSIAQAKFKIIPTTPINITVTPVTYGSAIYTVTNQTKLTRTLIMSPIKGVTQVTNTPNACAIPFTLAPQQSCNLNLSIDGSAIGAGQRINEGPVVCKTAGPGNNAPDPFLCSQPEQSDILKVLVTANQPSWKNLSTTLNTTTAPSIVTALAALPSAPSIIYAVLNTPFILKSTDSGQTWAATNSQIITTQNGGVGYTQAWDIKINPNQPNILYLATSAGVYKSTNAGVNWSCSGAIWSCSGQQTTPTGQVFSLAINPINPSIIYAGTGGTGVYKSIDAGATWQQINGADNLLNNRSIFSLAINSNAPDTLIAGRDNVGLPLTTSSIYKTVDGGQNWVVSSINIPTSFQRISSIVIDNNNTNICYATLRVGGIYKSTDGCVNWNSINNGIGALGFFTFSIRINPADSNELIVARGNGIFKSINAGGSWNLTNNGFTGFISSFVFPYSFTWPVGDLLLMGRSGGDNLAIYRTTDKAANWQTTSGAVIKNANVQALLIPSPNTLLASYYSSIGLYQTMNEGLSWQNLNNPALNGRNIGNLPASPANPSSLYLSNDNQGALRSINFGQGWQILGTLPSAAYFNYVIAKSNPNFMYISTNTQGQIGLYRSTDGGSSWTALPFFNGRNVGSIIIDQTNANVAYAASSISLSGTQQIHKTTDGGANWTQILSNDRTKVLSQSPFDSQTLYIVSSLGVQRSTNGGLTWENLSVGLPLNPNVSSKSPVITATNNPNLLFVGFYGAGVYQSINGGLTWSELNNGLTDKLVVSMAVDSFNADTIYVGTQFDGVFKFPA